MDKIKRVYWCGKPPEFCQICGAPIKRRFVDGKVRGTGWASMCLLCHLEVGVGLGIGKGQSYKKLASGDWLKVGG